MNEPVSFKNSSLDYTKINLPNFPNTRIQTAPLSTLDYAKFKVGCKLKNRSIGGNGQQAMTDHVLRSWHEDEQRLIVEANRLRITPEELFNQLVREDGNE
ncbi:hypothetical protein [Microseira sp. BLCC-F43]|jgi:hypothetical protein|uniref:hypothetical protein n=1 Tax=Microseira sp. BLCC-F43 TaxID=3153602 RepID=UPI0035B950D3